MSQSELALAVSVRSWPDELHRFLVDHGGARVRLTAMGPEDLAADSFDVLLIDDVCSFLSAGLVDSVTRRGASVLGVHDPNEYPDGRQRLLECGVGGVIEARAHPDEFLEAVARVRITGRDRPVAEPEVDRPRSEGAVVAIAGASGGVGTTEVAAAVAQRIGKRSGPVTLVDLDLAHSSLAQRLNLDPHPNLLSAIDSLERGDPVEAVQGHGGISVLAGRPAQAHIGGLRSHQVLTMLGAIRSPGDPIVLDLGAGVGMPPRLSGELASVADHFVLVGDGSPVGLARLLDRASHAPRPVHIVINRSPTDSYRKGEVIDEIRLALSPRSLALIPHDRNVATSAWAGEPVAGGRFIRGVNRWVDTFLIGSLG